MLDLPGVKTIRAKRCEPQQSGETEGRKRNYQKINRGGEPITLYGFYMLVSWLSYGLPANGKGVAAKGIQKEHGTADVLQERHRA